MKFVKDQYDRYDALGRKLTCSFLESHGYTIEPKEEEDYNIDIVAYKDGKRYFFEVEMKNTAFTDMNSFPYSTVSFLDRKKKFSKDHLFFYIIISSKTYAALIVRSDKIFKKEYLERLYINTRERSGEDYFYRIPKELCRFIPPEQFLINNNV